MNGDADSRGPRETATGGQEWPLHFSGCVSIIAAYGGSPQGDVLLISLRASGPLGDTRTNISGAPYATLTES